MWRHSPIVCMTAFGQINTILLLPAILYFWMLENIGLETITWIIESCPLQSWTTRLHISNSEATSHTAVCCKSLPNTHSMCSKRPKSQLPCASGKEEGWCSLCSWESTLMKLPWMSLSSSPGHALHRTVNVCYQINKGLKFPANL